MVRVLHSSLDVAVSEHEADARPQLGGQRLAGGPVEVGDHHVAARPRQQPRARGPQPGSAAGNEERLLLNLHKECLVTVPGGSTPRPRWPGCSSRATVLQSSSEEAGSNPSK